MFGTCVVPGMCWTVTESDASSHPFLSFSASLTFAEGPKTPLTPLTRLAVEQGLAIVAPLRTLIAWLPNLISFTLKLCSAGWS